MKIILLILGLLILITKKSSFINLFKTKEQMKEETSKYIKQMKEKIPENLPLEGIMILGAFVLSGLYILFYLLSSIYIGYFWFVILSILLIVDTIRVYLDFNKQMENIENFKIQSIFYRLSNLIIDVMYILFVFFTIYTRW